MNRLPFNEASLPRAAEILRHGGVIILPTDTVYGLACHPDFPEALDRIRAMKGRDANKPFQLLAASTDAVWEDSGFRTPKAEELAAHWPGALTLVLPTQKGHTEGYRVPDHPLLQQLIALCGGLLRCTSVNLSGEPPTTSAEAAAAVLGNKVDLILDGGEAPIGTASTVCALTPEGTLRILREGTIKI